MEVTQHARMASVQSIFVGRRWREQDSRHHFGMGERPGVPLKRLGGLQVEANKPLPPVGSNARKGLEVFLKECAFVSN